MRSADLRGRCRNNQTSSLSSVIGKSRTRTPVAWNTAFAIAATIPVIPISPIRPPGGRVRDARKRLQADCARNRGCRLQKIPPADVAH